MSKKKRDEGTFHDKERAKIERMRARLGLIDDAVKLKDWGLIDRLLRVWRKEIEESKED